MKKILWTIVLILVLVIVVFVLLPNVFKINVTLNVATALWALGVCGGVLVIYVIIKYITEPKLTVIIKLAVRLEEPKKISEIFGARTTFEVKTIYYIKRKGELEIREEEPLKIKFHRKEHPDLHKWCFEKMKEIQENAIENAQYEFPNARIILAQLPNIRKSRAISRKDFEQDYEYDE